MTSSFQKGNQVRQELHDHSRRDQNTGQIWREPAGIFYDLEDGALVVRVKARLIKRPAVVTQWIVHINQHLAALAGVRAVQQQLA